MVIGTIGVLRFPDVYTRLHASSKCGTTGVISIFIGLIIYKGFSLISLKIAVIAFFIFLTTPVSSHAIGKSAYDSKVGMWVKRKPLKW
jgi:multicomponent Na+:H+ antiporter subunit G